MYHRPQPMARASSSNLSIASHSGPSPILVTPPTPSYTGGAKAYAGDSKELPVVTPTPSSDGPSIFGMPLKYVSLVTLAVQNAALSIVMHYSRVSTPASQSYSPASAVLLNELLKGTISFVIALVRVQRQRSERDGTPYSRRSPWDTAWGASLAQLCGEIFSPDCWKLSIPAILYVIQNSLQFVAISNLPVATFQVTYQMKILTTAAFSVVLLRKRLGTTKWLSLFFLAIGVAIVQIQSQTTSGAGHVPAHAPLPKVGSAHDQAPLHIHVMSPLKGFGAVTAACFTSGLAGVYFEMVLKNSKADLWVRNVQLSLFSLVPALLPVLFHPTPASSRGFLSGIFAHFGGWAWATVLVQVFGGLVTAIVIKYSDNILKGFATSLSIVLSFLASVALFNFRITPSFCIGATTVLAATAMYNQPEGARAPVAIVLTETHRWTPWVMDTDILMIYVVRAADAKPAHLRCCPLASLRLLVRHPLFSPTISPSLVLRTYLPTLLELGCL
ncbi:nucleotide-sugar transporter-domain-containing protein [Schizophyllum commune]